MKVQELLFKLNNEYNFKLAEDFDDVGLIIGSLSAEVQQVMTCLNLNLDVCNCAVEKGCNVIISHHPNILFADIYNNDNKFISKNGIIKETYKGKLLNYIIKNNLNVICLHTNVDFENASISRWIGKYFGYKTLSEMVVDDKVLGIVVEINQNFADTLSKLKKKCNRVLNYIGNEEKLIKTALIIGGSGKSFTKYFVNSEIDLYITGDIDYSTFHDVLVQKGDGCLVDMGHDMEKVFENNVLKNIDVKWCSYNYKPIVKQF
ncbi:MAG: Nif3-like dinuclear metal center hexameric protein [Bacilli bacterium]